MIERVCVCASFSLSLSLARSLSRARSLTHTQVCSILKDLALAGRTVVATIHQPSSDVFHMFDNLLLLAKGRIMYQDTAAGVVSYFGERGFPCPRYTNPSGTKKLRQKNRKK